VSHRLETVTPRAATFLATSLSYLHRACFPDDPWSPQTIAGIISVCGFFGRIVWENDQPAGLALAQGLAEECEVLSIGVLPEHRRAGLGSALLAALVEEARRRGARTMFLEVAEDNPAARALYAVNGFVQIGRRANYYRRPSGLIDALILSLLLST
jgi:ribosomal-protein-alanine N-acetyltransferase